MRNLVVLAGFGVFSGSVSRAGWFSGTPGGLPLPGCIYRTPTSQFVLHAVGRQVFNFDQSQLISSHGPNAFVAAFFDGDAHSFDQICAALAA